MKNTSHEIEAVIFDFDGTLAYLNINFEDMRRNVETLISDHGLEISAFKGLYILEMIDEASSIISSRNPEAASLFYHEAHRRIAECELNAARRGWVFTGVFPLLRTLGAKRVKTAIITRNCRRAVQIVFPDIEQYCDVFIPRDDVKHVKPHPEHLHTALKTLAVSGPYACLMVGDHVLDIVAGKELEMPTAGVLTGNTKRDDFIQFGADYVLNDAIGVLDLIVKE